MLRCEHIMLMCILYANIYIYRTPLNLADCTELNSTKLDSQYVVLAHTDIGTDTDTDTIAFTPTLTPTQLVGPSILGRVERARLTFRIRYQHLAQRIVVYIVHTHTHTHVILSMLVRKMVMCECFFSV